MRTMITLTLARVWSNVSHTLLAERQTGITKPALSEVAQTVKRLLQCGRPGFDPWVGSSLEKEMATHSSTLQYSCLKNPMDGGAWCPWGRKESDTTERLHFHFECS